MSQDKVSVYLDYNATSPVRPGVADAVAASLREYGNPSSTHAFGRNARAAIEDARETLADALGVAPSAVVFTSGGTEANALALRGVARSAGCQSIIASAIEHPSVLSHVGDADRVPVKATGEIDLAALEKLLGARAAPALVALMLANNETGTLQPVAEAARIAKKHGALVHCDAVQALGKVAVDFGDLCVDSMSVSAHKAGGIKGAGALILRPGLEISADISGGGQERSRRAGTENVTGIVAFGAALVHARRSENENGRVQALRDEMEAEISRALPRARIFGRDAQRLGNTCCVAVPGVTSESQIMWLDLAGIAVSAGSACSSGKISPSHVLLAMGAAPEEAKAAIRVSLGWATTVEDIQRFLEVWLPLASKAAA
ncbi:MAG: cysteine desulfurase family protein [Rhodospirillaceae bacterium]